jgi:hypothetical protein
MEPRLCGSAQIIAAGSSRGKRRTAKPFAIVGKWRWTADLQGKKNPR